MNERFLFLALFITGLAPPNGSRQQAHKYLVPIMSKKFVVLRKGKITPTLIHVLQSLTGQL